ncbi:MAG TPA: metalloregulator ArsR/SmtB family transcription factor [Paenibacillus sp.]|nr:metalloregulator ArsR/SmtB family transcription factor [Paenibacillus sp.]
MNVADLDPSIEAMADQLKLLADKTRLTIVALLRDRELCVCDIAALLGISQPGVSQHLKKMKLAGLLAERRQGQWAYYYLRLDDKPHLAPIVQRLPDIQVPESCHSACCD